MNTKYSDLIIYGFLLYSLDYEEFELYDTMQADGKSSYDLLWWFGESRLDKLGKHGLLKDGDF